MNRRTVFLRSVGLVAGIIVLPLGIWGFSFAAPALSGVTAASAALTLGGRTGTVSSPDKPVLLGAPAAAVAVRIFSRNSTVL